MSDAMFKSPEARENLKNWYDRFLSKLDVPYEHLSVPTSQGDNHVLAVGDRQKPALVCLHGAMGSSAHTASELGPLLERHRVLLPDLPGYSVRGPQQSLPLDDTWADWFVEVIDGLDLGRIDLLAISWGGFVGLRAAATVPERIHHLVLMVPAGIVNGSVWKGLTRVMIPMLMYRFFPSEERLRRFVEPTMTTWDEDWAHYLGAAFRGMNVSFRPPPTCDLEDLANFQRPTLVFAAADDLSFPGRPMLERLDELIPHAESELMKGCKHMPPTTDDFRAWMADRVTAFLSHHGSTPSKDGAFTDDRHANHTDPPIPNE